ncbi:hypothetical protein Q1695_009931 [Nippostrongylus brasiliensis]|nr:hypothetical protein Q1695_009931 [Nippostrongylus brasiliensis]
MEDTVRRFLEAFHIQVKDKWMQDTVNFIRSHGKGENEDDLRRAVFEQFLHSNLADSYEPLSKVPVGALKAVIVKPMIFQESRLRTSTSNSRRLLKVKLTDGQNEVHGIEYGGKIDLDQMAIAGTKILLTSRVLLRRGILLLNTSNCQVLGGDVDGQPLDLAAFFAERLGINHDSKTNRRVPSGVSAPLPLLATSAEETSAKQSSTMSPYLVRKPRIPAQLLHSTETDAQPRNITLKNEVHDIERTAIVLPVQSGFPNRMTGNAASWNGNTFGEEPMDTSVAETGETRTTDRVTLPVGPAPSSSSFSEDLPISVEWANIVPHEVKPPVPQSAGRPSVGGREKQDLNRSIADYFPVSRLKRETESKCKISDGEGRVGPVSPTPKKRLLLGLADNDSPASRKFTNGSDSVADSAVASSFYEESGARQKFGYEHVRSDLYADRATPERCHRLQRSPERDSRNDSGMLMTDRQPEYRLPIPDICQTNPMFAVVTPPALLRDTSPPPLRADVCPLPRAQNSYIRRSFEEEDKNFTTTQQLLNIQCEPNPHRVENSELISFIEESISKELSVKEMQTPPRSNHLRDELPSTAVVPFKRPLREPSSEETREPLEVGPVSTSRYQGLVMERFEKLKIIRFVDAFAQRKFWMLPKTVHVMILHREKNLRELARCKERASEVMKGFQRLDLVFSLKIHPQRDKVPLMVNVCTLAEAIEGS